LAVAIEAMERRVLMSASYADGFQFSVGARPTDIVVADLNGDGQPDVATANSAANGISVRYGNPGTNGSFSSVFTFPTGGVAPEYIAAGKLDGDADIDLVVVSTDGTYVVYLNSAAANNFANLTAQTPVATGLAAGAAKLRDMNNDGLNDLVIVGNIAGDARGYRIYAGLGNGGFASVPVTGALNITSAETLAIDDYDGNGTLDIATVDDASAGSRQLAVVLNPMTAPSTNYTQFVNVPNSVAAGDFNKDGKADLVVALSGTNVFTIDYLQNNGDGTFAAPVVPDFPTFYHRAVATADVDGDGNLDALALGGQDSLYTLQGKGDGTFVTERDYATTGAFPYAMAQGDFNGDGKVDLVVANYDADAFTVHLNTSTPGLPGDTTSPPTDPAPANPLTAEFGRVTLPSVFVPGDRATAQVIINNTSATAVRGKANVTLYASLDGTLDASDVALDTGATLFNKTVSARAGGKVTLTGRFVAPASLANGTYFLLAKVTPSGITDATEITAATPTAFEKTTSFGQVGTRRNVRYSFTDADGTLVTFSLSGPGTGIASTGLDGLTLTLNGTTTASRLNATARGGEGDGANEVFVTHLNVNGPMAAVNGKAIEITGSMTIGDVRTVTLNDVHGVHGNIDDAAVSFNGTTPITLRLADVRDATITSTAPIRSLRALAWTNVGFDADSLSAPYIGSITIDDNFDPSVTLTGADAPRGTALASVRIGSNVGAQPWAIGGNVGTVTIGGSVPTGWVGNVAGSVRSLTVKGDFAGKLAAANVGSLAVTGNATNASVRAGWSYGPDNVPNTPDDTSAAGIITRLSVRGSVTGSEFYAGADAIGAPIAGGLIRSIAMTNVDSATRFVAASLPPTVRFDGTTIITAEDPRFVTTVV
jgi:hypothetical protein